MKRASRGWVAVIALCGGTMFLTGCGEGGNTVSGMTLAEAEAESTTTEIVDAVIASVDPASVERVDDVTNESLSCRGTDIDPDGSVRAWENLRYVWLREGLDKFETLDALVTAAVDDGWELAREPDASDDEGRWVQLRQASGDREGYGLRFTSGAEDDGQNVVYVASDSPCFEAPVDER